MRRELEARRQIEVMRQRQVASNKAKSSDEKGQTASASVMFRELTAEYKQKQAKIQKEEQVKRQQEKERNIEARRQEIEKEARESPHAADIKAAITILMNKDRHSELRICRRAMLVKLAMEDTDPEDDDQTMEYVELSKVIKMITNKPGQLYKLPSVRASTDTTDTSSSNTSSEDEQDSSDKDRKGEKSKKTVRRQKREQRRMKKKNN